MRFEPLPGPHGFGAALVGGVAPAALARIDAAQVDALAAALDAHALLVLRCDAAASAAELAEFATRLLGAGGLVDFSGVSADARNQGAGSALCHAEGVPAVRVLGNVTGAGGEAKALLCRIGAGLRVTPRARSVPRARSRVARSGLMPAALPGRL